MSRQNIERDLRKYAGADKDLDTKLRRVVSTRAYTHEVSISVTKLKEGFVSALKKVEDDDYRMAVSKYNKPKIWVKAINTVLKRAMITLPKGGKIGKKWGVPRILATGRIKMQGPAGSVNPGLRTGNYTLLMFSHTRIGNVTHLADVLTYIKDSIYEEWRTTNDVGEELEQLKKQQSFWKRVIGSGPEGWRQGGAQKKYRDEIQFSHAEESTVATATISKAVKDALTQPTYGSYAGMVVTNDLIWHLWKELEIDWWEETTTTAKGSTKTERVVRGVLHKDNMTWPTDRGQIDWDKLIKIINEWFADKSQYLNEKEAIDFEASPSFRDQARASAQYAILRNLMEKNKKHVAAKKVKTRKPKYGKKKRSGKLKSRSTKATTSTTSFVAAAKSAPKISKGPEKGAGAEASTDQAAELARLRKYIQSRLPAEVRRNMGRPGLQNRTGRFSNSVQLLSLTQAQSTVMAKYTYLLSPYQTFENTGKKRWPMAYNPKPLIAKSIRNLALGRIEQKLTVRRV